MAQGFCSAARRKKGRISKICNPFCSAAGGQKNQPDGALIRRHRLSGGGDLRAYAPALNIWRASHSLTASSTSPCMSVPLANAIALKRAAVSRGIENVMFVSVFSSLPLGFVRK
jgi:hypothetical protein